MLKPGRLRITLGGMLILVALIAVAIAYFKPAETRIFDVKVGTGAPVRVGDTVTVHYVGKLSDGTVFDNSKPRGEPVAFAVGRGQLIRGWDIGILGMRPGGIRRLTIPPEHGYGEKGAGPIPPNATLDFEIELIEVKSSFPIGSQASE